MTERWGLLVLGLLAITAAAVGAVVTYHAPTAGPGVRAVVSSPTDPDRRLLAVQPRTGARATARITVDTEARRQAWRGSGAALTDASVELLAGHRDSLGRLFDPDADDGARLTWLRLPLTSTDMSPTPWTWGWDGTTASPHPRAEAALAVVRDIRDLQPRLRVVATPWTAPEWMKEPRGIRGGALRDDAVQEYAAMLVAEADALVERGVPLAAMTLGNEPGFGADYPSMTMTDQQQVALARVVGPALHERRVELWAVDHNWADRPRHDAVLAGAPDAFDAAAFHCYAGSADQMAGVAVPPIVTECSGTRSTWAEAFAWDARHLVADATTVGSTGLIMWNLATDPSGGPRDTASADGCATCRGLLTVEGDEVEPGPELYVLAQLQRAAGTGSRVVASRATDGIAVAAFAHPDGSLGVFAHNGTGDAQVLGIDAPGRDELRYDVRAGEILSVRADVVDRRVGQ